MHESSVLLLAMPWNRPDYPSVQVGRLKAFLSGRGIDCHASYPYLSLADTLGEELYVYICETVDNVLLEGVFCSIYKGQIHGELVTELATTSGLLPESIEKVVDVCSKFLNVVLSSHDWEQYSHVGFTCTFSQTWSSLAMAKIIKEKHPQIRIVFGGTALDQKTAEYIEEHFTFVNYVVSGPGEVALLEILQNPSLPKGHRPGHTVLLQHLSTVPDYTEYLTQLSQSEMLSATTAILTTSVGCDYSRCVFCALNRDSGYLALSSDQIGELVSRFMAQHNVSRIEFADTSLVAIHSDENLCDRLATFGVEFYGEMRAVLDREKAQRLKRSGFSGVQIGVESLNTSVLKTMAKSVDLVQNIFNLKLCLEYELEVAYNLILDYPGTTDEQLNQMLSLIPIIVHLPPPSALCRFVLYKGSPAFLHPEEHGISACRPSHLYELSLGEHYGRSWPATQFDYTPFTAPSIEMLGRVDSACGEWANAYDPQNAILSIAFQNDHAVVTDRRFSKDNIFKVYGEDARCLRFCEEPRRVSDLQDSFEESTINSLVEMNLLIIDNHRALSLPVITRQRDMGYRERPNSEFAYTLQS